MKTCFSIHKMYCFLHTLIFASTILGMGCSGGMEASRLPVFDIGDRAPEEIVESHPMERMRAVRNSPAIMAPTLPHHFVLYGLPNGNSVEWTAGRVMNEDLDWHYDIQHIAAQTRHLRMMVRGSNLSTVYLEAENLSWPRWRQEVPDANEQIRDYVMGFVDPPLRTVTLTGHSGGGSFTFGFLNAVERIPDGIERIAFLDSNYGFSANAGHGEKLAEWLNRNPRHTLIVLAYDDRSIEIDGRRVVSDTGGTYRATLERMVPALEDAGVTLVREERDPWIIVRSPNGQVDLRVHTNPDNRILHTVMVGEMNGLVHALTVNTDLADPEGLLVEERVYTRWVLDGDMAP